MIRHAGLIARRVAGVWRGALIEGPSGVSITSGPLGDTTDAP